MPSPSACCDVHRWLFSMALHEDDLPHSSSTDASDPVKHITFFYISQRKYGNIMH
jgi:hypothetical protein